MLPGDSYWLVTGDLKGWDLEVFSHEGQVYIRMDSNGNDRYSTVQGLTPEQAQELGEALIRYATLK